VFNIKILRLVTASKNLKKTLKCHVLIVKISGFVPCDPKQGITVRGILKYNGNVHNC